MKLGNYLKDRDFFYLMHLSSGTRQEEDRKEHWNYALSNNLIGLDIKEVKMDWNKLSEVKKKRIRSQRSNWFRQFERFCNEMQKEFDTFSNFIWSFVGRKTIKNKFSELSEVPSQSVESANMSKEMKRRGFKFIGPTICYAFMQATGLVNDHLITCFRYNVWNK